MSSLLRSLLLLTLGALVACSSATEPEPLPADPAEPQELPGSVAELHVRPPLSPDQIRQLDAGLVRWRQSDDPEISGLAFFASAQRIVDRDQFRSLVNEVRDHRRLDGDHGSGPPHGLGHGWGRGGLGFLRGLDLSEEQKEQIHAAIKAHRMAMMELRRDVKAGNLTREEFRAAMRSAREELHNTIRGILTEEQIAEIEERHRDHLVKRLTHRLEHWDERVERRVGHLSDILDLTEQQTTELTQVLSDAKSDLQTILDGVVDESLSLADARAELRAWMEAIRAAIAEILDAEQLALYDDLMSACRGHDGRP